MMLALTLRVSRRVSYCEVLSQLPKDGPDPDRTHRGWRSTAHNACPPTAPPNSVRIKFDSDPVCAASGWEGGTASTAKASANESGRINPRGDGSVRSPD